MLGHLVFFLCGLSHMSRTSLLLFLLCRLFRVFLLGGLFSELFVCATISSPLVFFSLGRVCSPLGSFSSLLPSCIATVSHGFLLWPTTYAVRGLFPLVMRLYFGCLLAHDSVPGWSSFLVIFFSSLLEFAISFLSVRFSLVYYADFICLDFSPFPFRFRLARLLWLFSFRCLLPALLPPAFICTYSFSFAYPLLSVLQFVSPVHSCWYMVSFPVWIFAPFLPLSLSLVSLPASFPGFSLSLEFVCGLPVVPSYSFTGSSFLLVLILLPCLLLLRLSVLRFRFSSATSPLVVISTLFRGLPSLGFIASVCLGCSLLL